MSQSPTNVPRSYNSVLDLKLASPTNSASGATGGWIVQKFGGTSVGKFPENIVDNIVKVYSQTNRVAVVCSARSSQTKVKVPLVDYYAVLIWQKTIRIINHFLNAIEEDHVTNAERIQLEEIKQELIKDTKQEIEHVRELLHACQIIGEISPRSLDSIMAVGEKLSCLFMTALMKDHGLNAVYINLQDVIPLSYDFQKGLMIHFINFIPRNW